MHPSSTSETGVGSAMCTVNDGVGAGGGGAPAPARGSEVGGSEGDTSSVHGGGEQHRRSRKSSGPRECAPRVPRRERSFGQRTSRGAETSFGRQH